VGKTTAQLQVINDLLKSNVSSTHILRVQCDEIPTLHNFKEPILRIVDWFEQSVMKKTMNEAALAGEQVYLFWDEVQNLKDWSTQLKYLVDHTTCQVVVTGSSALRIEQGRDSLAGRITTLDVGPLSLTEIATVCELGPLPPFLPENGYEPLTQIDTWRSLVNHGIQNRQVRDLAYKVYSDRGGYPLSLSRREVPWSDVSQQLNETVIKRVIEHDLRIGDRGRKRDPQLLEFLFKLCCRYCGQAPHPSTFVREVHRALSTNIGPQRVAQYLKFLSETLLVRLVLPMEIRLRRVKAAPKICLADHGLRASWLQEIIPLFPADLDLSPHLADLAGHIAESVLGGYLLGAGFNDIAHLPERKSDPEVDFVLTVGDRRIPIEVKYRRTIDSYRDTEGLRTFIETKVHNAEFGVIVTRDDGVAISDPRIVAVPLSSLMLLR
jgi:predicted AAA+ superfamily ATPase